MSEPFTLDTSGRVECTDPHQPCICHAATWEQNDPFTQGYIEAALETARRNLHGVSARINWPTDHPRAFSDLAPETLAAILKDCEAAAPGGGMHGYPRGHESAEADARGAGAEFWRRRNRFTFKRFPPLTPYLGDDGKVYLRNA